MDKEIKDGGPAFPACFDVNDHPRRHEAKGMSLRDWFAGQALAGISRLHPGAEKAPQRAACYCYEYADAMIAARKLKHGD